MPELPEVETIRRDLAAGLPGARVESVWTSGKPLRLARPLDRRALLDACVGRRFAPPRRRGKYLLLDVEGGHVVVVHLGMSGCLRLAPAGEARLPHTHVVWRLDGGRELRFVDPRRFGFVRAARRDREAQLAELARLGPDPLDVGFTPGYLRARARATARGLKTFLLDQSVVAGLGNIYVAEALFEARIHPGTKANRLSPARAATLRDAILTVLSRSLGNRGTTLRDYVDADGEAGHNQHVLRVYGRDGEPCLRRDGGRVRRVVTQGRSTFYCPSCQRRS